MISVVKIFKILLLLCSLLLAGCFVNEAQDPVHEFKGDVFGSYYIVKYRGDLDPEVFRSELNSFFSDFNNEFSTYQKNSVISQFNQAHENRPMKVSARFIQMLKLAHQFYLETQGAFDPTLGPVIKLWGFGGGDHKKTPSKEEIKEAISRMGFKSLKWDERTLTVWKTKSGLELDINAFAPGWVCDLLSEFLISKGVKDFMVDLSGEIVFKGTKTKEHSWVAGIEKPSLSRAQGVQVAFKAQDMSLSTSGNYRQFFNEKGQRRSHLIDPRTGAPVIHSISSASVIGQTGAQADAWSTALMILGTEGMVLAEKYGMKVLLLDALGPDSFEEVVSPSMSRFIQLNKL